MRVFVEAGGQCRLEETRELLRELLSLESSGATIDVIKDSACDFNGCINVNVYVVEGCFSLEALNSICNKSIFKCLNVSLIPESSFELLEADLDVNFYRKNIKDSRIVTHVDCNVSIEHLPSGMLVECERFRNRSKNISEAKCYLASKLMMKAT